MKRTTPTNYWHCVVRTNRHRGAADQLAALAAGVRELEEGQRRESVIAAARDRRQRREALGYFLASAVLALMLSGLT